MPMAASRDLVMDMALEVHGRFVVDGRVAAVRIVPPLDVVEQLSAGDRVGRPPLSRYTLTELNRFNPKVCGLQPPCLRLTPAVTDTRSRLGMGCAGSALSQWHSQPRAVRHFVAHYRKYYSHVSGKK